MGIKRKYKLEIKTIIEKDDIDDIREAIKLLGCVHGAFLEDVLQGFTLAIKSSSDRGDPIVTHLAVVRQDGIPIRKKVDLENGEET